MYSDTSADASFPFPELTVEKKPGLFSRPMTWVIVGIALLAFFVLGTGMLIFRPKPTGDWLLEMKVTGAGSAGVFALIIAYFLIQSPKRITLNTHGFVLHYKNREVVYAWDEVVWIDQTKYGNNDVLYLFGDGARVLAKIPDHFEIYSMLKIWLLERMAKFPSPKLASTQRSLFNKRGRIAALVAIIAFAGMTFLIYMQMESASRDRLVKSDGKPSYGIIESKTIAPNGYTKRIMFKVNDPNGKYYTHNLEFVSEIWETFTVGQSVPIIAVPGRPDAIEPPMGSVRYVGPGGKLGELLVPLLAFIIGLFAAFLGVFYFWGIEFHYEQSRGFFVIRIGQSHPPIIKT